jgi:hypothetical protein
MERRRITCPDSAHLEEVDFERTAHGLVVAGCSRFAPSCAVTCGGECARRLDRKEQLHDARDRVLVVYGRAAWTQPVATALAELLLHDGFVVEMADADACAAPPPDDYDCVLIGSPQRLGRSTRAILEYVEQHRDALATMPAFWFAVGRMIVPAPDRMQRATGWLPTRTFAIVRPSRSVRWFGDPNAKRAPQVCELARTVADEIPAPDIYAR